MDRLKYISIDKAAVIIDLGVQYTKIGFVGENSPRKILITPFKLFKNIKSLDIEVVFNEQNQ